MSKGKYFTGVCEGCVTQRQAEKYEQEIREKASELAKQKNIKALVENYRDELAGGEKISLNAAFDQAMKKPRRKMPSEKHIQAKRSYWRDFTNFIEGEFPELEYLSAIRSKHAEEYVHFLRTQGRYNKTVKYGNGEKKDYQRKGILSNRTCNLMQDTIKEVFELLMNDAGLIENPFKGIKKLRRDQETREAFTEAELKKIAGNADEFIYPLFSIGICTALREGDICTLKWKEVNFSKKIITRKMLKTGKVVQIPIMLPLQQYLNELQEKKEDSEYVLPVHAEMYLKNPNGISRRVKKFLDSLKIKNTKMIKGRTKKISIKDIHSLRHTFCYYAGVYGIPFLIVKDICGHVNEKMTELYQSHADNQVKREKLLQMPDFMGLLPEQAINSQTKDKKREKLKNMIDSLPAGKIEELLEIAQR